MVQHDRVYSRQITIFTRFTAALVVAHILNSRKDQSCGLDLNKNEPHQIMINET